MREKGSRYPKRERERQGLNGRGTASGREGEQAYWRRGKPEKHDQTSEFLLALKYILGPDIPPPDLCHIPVTASIEKSQGKELY